MIYNKSIFKLRVNNILIIGIFVEIIVYILFLFYKMIDRQGKLKKFNTFYMWKEKKIKL